MKEEKETIQQEATRISNSSKHMSMPMTKQEPSTVVVTSNTSNPKFMLAFQTRGIPPTNS